MLLLHALFAGHAASRLTVTHDEYWHFPVGVLTWSTGRFDLDRLNPPLARALAGLPVAGAAQGLPGGALEGSPTEIGDAFLLANRARYRALLTISRLVIVLLSVVSGWLAARWAWEWFGPQAACLTALLWATEPTLLANAGLVTTDLGAAAAFVIVLYAARRFAQVPTFRRAAVLGLALGAAQLVKFTCILLAPLSLVMWGLLRFVDWRESLNAGLKTAASPGSSVCSSAHSWRSHLGNWAAAGLIALLVLNTGYLFRGTGTRLGAYQFSSASMQSVQRFLKTAGQAPVPLPRDYLVGLDRQRHIMEGEHPVYLDGTWRTRGFGSYYFLALWYKLPHAFLGLLACTLWGTVRPAGEDREAWRLLSLCLPVAALLGVASGESMQLGVRYLLPAFPFLCLIAGRAAVWCDWKRFRRRTACVVIAALLLPLSLRHHPHHLTYFNELAGGPERGGEHLLDSNLDWGQALYLLPEAIERHQIRDLKLAYFGTAPPGEFGIEYTLPQRFFAPGWYAVSVNFVHGRPHVVRDPSGAGQPIGLDEYPYLRAFQPRERLGNALYLYDLRMQNRAQPSPPHQPPPPNSER